MKQLGFLIALFITIIPGCTYAQGFPRKSIATVISSIAPPIPLPALAYSVPYRDCVTAQVALFGRAAQEFDFATVPGREVDCYLIPASEAKFAEIIFETTQNFRASSYEVYGEYEIDRVLTQMWSHTAINVLLTAEYDMRHEDGLLLMVETDKP